MASPPFRVALDIWSSLTCTDVLARSEATPGLVLPGDRVGCRWQVCSPFPTNPAEGVPTCAALVARPGLFRPAQASPLTGPCPGTRKLRLSITVISKCPQGKGRRNSLSLGQQQLPRPVSWLGQSFRSPHPGVPTSGTSHLPSLPLALMSCPARDHLPRTTSRCLLPRHLISHHLGADGKGLFTHLTRLIRVSRERKHWWPGSALKLAHK